MQKIYILDTNVLLHDPEAIYRFAHNQIVIPVEVIEELDTFKHNMTELGQHSRTVSQYLESLAKKGDLGEGVNLDNGGSLRVYSSDVEDHVRRMGLGLKKPIDNRILNLALSVRQSTGSRIPVIVSKNVNLRLKAHAIGIAAEDYGDIRSSRLASYTGYHELAVDQQQIERLMAEGSCNVNDGAYLPNEYILLNAENHGRVQALGRIEGKTGRRLVRLAKTSPELFGIRPLNLGQTFALDALLDDNIKLVTLMGRAGTGKTLLAAAAGLHKVLIEDQYNKLLISRPIMPLGRDIGYIPGDITEKMRPWMQPIYDAIDTIRERDRRSKSRMLPPDVLMSEDIGIEALTYIRGRSIDHQYLIIDESQNLTPHEVKTIITRIGDHSKVVLTGDTEQIDNPYVDARSNGFSYLIDRFRTEEIAAHITLVKGERSELAELAAERL